MTPWWARDFARLALERETVDRAVEEGWFRLTRWRSVDGFRLAAKGIILVGDTEYPVRLVYPAQFPLVPAWVEPQDPSAHWSSHQYGGTGVLCLELRPDNWHPSVTGGDVLRSAYNLLRTENPLGSGPSGSVPSAHHVGEVQAYTLGAFPVLIGQGCIARIHDGSATNVKAIRSLAVDDISPIFVYDDADVAHDRRPPSADAFAGRHDLTVRIARTDTPEITASSRADLASQLALDLSGDDPAASLLVLAVGDSRAVPYHSWDAESAYQRTLAVLADDEGARSGRDVSAGCKRVAIIGVGSVGSKLAESIVRGGGGSLILIDGDVMLPGNVERHALDWRDVGFRKVNALKRRLLAIRPSAEVFTFPYNLDWQRSAQLHATLIDVLAKCDLIVDASGDAPTGLFVGAVAAENRKPLLSVEVFEGGIGCVIARSIPGRDGVFAEVRAALGAYCEQRGVTPPASGPRSYEALSPSGSPVVADDAAVSVAAAHAARIAVDILWNELDDDAPAILLIGLRRAWLFTGHGNTIGLHAPSEATPVSACERSLSEREESARAFVCSVLEEGTDENSHSG